MGLGEESRAGKTTVRDTWGQFIAIFAIINRGAKQMTTITSFPTSHTLQLNRKSVENKLNL